MKPGKASKTTAARVAFSVAGLAIVAMVTMLAGRDHASATSFNPTLKIELASTAPGANSDATSEFNINAPDSNFGGVVAFVPSAFVPTSTTVAVGAIVGKLDAVATLGLVNAPCALALPVSFTMLNGSTNTGDTISPATTGDTLAPLTLDANGNGIPDGIDKYPSYLNTLFPGLTPLARAMGLTNVAGLTVGLNFLLFQPGTVFPATSLGPGLPAPDANLGYPSVTVLQDPTVPPVPSPITDFCSPLKSTSLTYGLSQDNPGTGPNEGGAVVRTNPADGVYNFVTFARSLRDADDDGVENSLDTCPYSADPDFDPRKAAEAGAVPNPTSDPDNDGIPNSCDPTPNVNTTNNDHDFDRFANRGDNCPLVSNNDAKDSDFDAIGDACDQNPTVPDGHLHELCIVAAVTIGAGGTAPPVICPGGAALTAHEPGQTDTTGQPPGGGPSGTGPATTRGTGPGGGPTTGVGSLAPVASAIPAWAAIATGLGSAGLLSSVAALFRRRRP